MCLVCKTNRLATGAEFFSLERDGVVGPRSRAETRTPGAGDRDGGDAPYRGSGVRRVRGGAVAARRAARPRVPTAACAPRARACAPVLASGPALQTAARGSAPHERRSSGYYGSTAEAATTEERRDRCTISTIIRVVFDCGSSYRSVAWRRYSDRRLPGSGLPSGLWPIGRASARVVVISVHAVFVTMPVTIGGKDCRSHWLR